MDPLRAEFVHALPNDDQLASCASRANFAECDFTRERLLPDVAADELIYRRPGFLIATAEIRSAPVGRRAGRSSVIEALCVETM